MNESSEQPSHLVPGYLPPGTPTPPEWAGPQTVQRSTPEPAPTSGGPITVYAAIGNSDDRLSQAAWSQFAGEFVSITARYARAVHGEWFSSPEAPFQNACICFEIDPSDAGELRRLYVELAHYNKQDSIAWTVAATTEFLGPGTPAPDAAGRS